MDAPEGSESAPKRVRLWPHTKGLYATHLSIPVKRVEAFEALRVKHFPDSAPLTDELHISVSRTFPVHRRQITALQTQLCNAIQSAELRCFSVRLNDVVLLPSESGETVFVCIRVAQSDELEQLVDTIDDVLEAQQLPVFHEQPVFHVSVGFLQQQQAEKYTPQQLQSIESVDLTVRVTRFQLLVGKDITYFDLP